MVFTKETHNLVLNDYVIKGCAIQNKDRQVYVVVEDNDEKMKDGYLPNNRFVYTFNEQEEPMNRFFALGYEHFNKPKIAYHTERSEIIGLDMRGQLFSRAFAKEREEDNLPAEIKGSELRTVYTNLKTIGESMYAVGIPRLLYKRIGVDDWEHLSESIPLPDEYLGIESDDVIDDPGWNDLAGFSEQDMYLVGGDGDVWQYDGSDFNQCNFSSNEMTRNVCCAGDGYVYIGGRMGRIWKGKKDTWELVSDEEFNIPWKDMVWFDNRLFLGSDYGLWEFKDGEVITAEVPDQVRNCSGSLSICPEKKYLLTAGNNGASIYDGKEWTVLFDKFNLPDS